MSLQTMAKQRPKRNKKPTSKSVAQAKQFHPQIAPIHGQKIEQLLANRKTPSVDKPRIEAAKERYLAWVKEMDELTLEGEALLEKLV